MAVITANYAVDLMDIDFEGDWLDPANTVTLLNNVNFTSPQGNVYEDVLRVVFGDEPTCSTRRHVQSLPAR